MAKTTDTTTATSPESTMLADDTSLELVIPWLTVEPVYQKVSRKMAKRVKIDGFRKGKVPTHLAKQVVGQEQVIELTLEEVVPPAYVALITEQNKRPLGNPEFHPESVTVGQDWKLHVHIAEKPVFELGDWKKIVKSTSAKYVQEKARIEKEASAKKTTADDKKVTKTEKSEKEDAEKSRSDQLGMIYGALVTTIRPKISQLLVKQEATSQLRQLGEQLERFNLTFESFLAQRNMTQEQLTNQVAAEALGRLQLAFIIDAIIQELKFQPTSAEIDQELKDKTPDIQEYYAKNPDARSALENRLAQQKTETYLLKL